MFLIHFYLQSESWTQDFILSFPSSKPLIRDKLAFVIKVILSKEHDHSQRLKGRSETEILNMVSGNEAKNIGLNQLD